MDTIFENTNHKLKTDLPIVVNNSWVKHRGALNMYIYETCTLWWGLSHSNLSKPTYDVSYAERSFERKRFVVKRINVCFYSHIRGRFSG